MYGLLNIGSLLLGLAAWALPAAALVSRRRSALLPAASFSLCSLSLLLQLCNTQYLVTLRDWSAIEDTHFAVVFAAAVLLSVTAILNLAAWLLSRRR